MCSEFSKTQDCGKVCSGMCTQPKEQPGTLWIILCEENRVTLYEKGSHQGVHPLYAPELGAETLNAYLKDAHRQYKFSYLVLVGSREDMTEVRRYLSPNTQKLIMADIERCFNGQTCDVMREKLECLIGF